MKQFKIIVAYDGTGYYGWQAQPGKPTIAQVLQDTFHKVFSESITILGASRTDAGVHALGQVASFKTNVTVDPEIMIWAWNNILPGSIMICHIQEVDQSFHLFTDVQQKTYVYTIFTQQPLPFTQRNGWFIKKKISVDLLRKALAAFVGTHDFRSFSTGDGRGDDTVRTIDSIEVVSDKEGGTLQIIVKGQKFLRHMIRRIVGAAVNVATGRDGVTVDFLRNALLEKNPRQPLTNAPAKGLLLHSIIYKSESQDSVQDDDLAEQPFFFAQRTGKLKEIS